MSAPSETPRAAQETCPPCRGLCVLSHGAPYETSADRCDRCGGTGTITRLYCPVELLAGIECGERVALVVRRYDVAQQTWGCVNGHRFEFTGEPRTGTWSRASDVGVVEGVA